MDAKLGQGYSGALRRETAEARAEPVFSEELRRLGRKGAELATRRKADPAKLAIASRLRKETTPSIRSIPARVHPGTSKSANARLHAWMPSRPPATGSKARQLGIRDKMKNDPPYGLRPFPVGICRSS